MNLGYTVEPNPDLKPETSKGIETGIRGKFDEGSFEIAVFYNKYRDFIDEDNVVVGGTVEAVPGRQYQARQRQRARKPRAA